MEVNIFQRAKEVGKPSCVGGGVPAVLGAQAKGERPTGAFAVSEDPGSGRPTGPAASSRRAADLFSRFL